MNSTTMKNVLQKTQYLILIKQKPDVGITFPTFFSMIKNKFGSITEGSG